MALRNLSVILLACVVSPSPVAAPDAPNLLCQTFTVGPGGAVYGWVNLTRAPDRHILWEEYRFGFNAWRIAGGEWADEPTDSIYFDAVWDLRNGRLAGSLPMREFTASARTFSDLPLPARIVMLLDGRAVGESINRQVAERTFVRTTPNGVEHMSGTPGGHFIGGEGTVPSVYGHRGLELVAYNEAGSEIRRVSVRLPNWHRVANAVRRASAEAHESECTPDIPIE